MSELPFPAVTYNGKDLDVAEAFAQANRRFLELESVVPESTGGGTIADRSITNVKLVLATITGAEIAVGTITGANIGAATVTSANITITNLSALSKDVGTVSAGVIQSTLLDADEGFSINLSDGTIFWGGTTNKYFQIDKYGQLVAKLVDIQGKVITLSGEVGPFTVSGAKLYSAAVSHTASDSLWGTNPNALIVDGDDSTWRLWVGTDSSPGTANFAVDKNGYLTSKSPTLSGGTWSSGTFSGDLSAANIPAGKVLTLGAGAYFEWSGDTNLYRSAVNTLRTDDNLSVGSVISDSAVTGQTGYFGTSSNNVALAGGNVVITGSSSNTIGLIADSGLMYGKSLSVTGEAKGDYLITTAPGGGTGPAIKFGAISSPGSLSLDTSSYWSVSVGGTTYKIALVT